FLLKPGLNFQYRETHRDGDSEITRDIVPTFWFVFPEVAKEWGRHSWSLGYDATVFDRDSTLQSDHRAIEHRGNIKSSMRFARAGRRARLSTFDLDRSGSEEPWEGGAGHFGLDLKKFKTGTAKPPKRKRDQPPVCPPFAFPFPAGPELFSPSERRGYE